jgi:hypothetical protein
MSKPDPENESLFRRLVQRNAINFHSPAFAAGIVNAQDKEPSVRDMVKSLLHEVIKTP